MLLHIHFDSKGGEWKFMRIAEICIGLCSMYVACRHSQHLDNTVHHLLKTTGLSWGSSEHMPASARPAKFPKYLMLRNLKQTLLRVQIVVILLPRFAG
mgnify:CR=1 FL=1